KSCCHSSRSGTAPRPGQIRSGDGSRLARPVCTATPVSAPSRAGDDRLTGRLAPPDQPDARVAIRLELGGYQFPAFDRPAVHIVGDLGVMSRPFLTEVLISRCHAWSLELHAVARRCIPQRPRTCDDVSVGYWLTKYTLGVALKIIFRSRAWGAKNVPRRGP